MSSQSKQQPEVNKQHTAADIKKVAGLSYRQINDWDAKGALPGDRAEKSCWRKFTSREVFVILVCSEIRRRFGVPIESLVWLNSFMRRDDSDHFSVALEMMRHGLAVFILTDLRSTFIMDADIEFENLFSRGFFRSGEAEGFIFLSVNPLVNRMLRAVDPKAHLQIYPDLYRAIQQNRARFEISNMQEFELLRILRTGNFTRLTITPKRNGELLVETEEEFPANAELGALLKGSDFQTTEVTKQGGKVVRINRKLPQKIGGKDEQPSLIITRSRRTKTRR